MKTRIWVLLLAAAVCLLFAAGIYAKVADVIIIDSPGCENTKGPVEFSHKLHAEDYVQKYPKLYPTGCGDCHHDDKGQPLTNLTNDSAVQKCVECHKQCGEAPKGKDAPRLDKKAKMAWIGEAFHQNCLSCHRQFNREFKPEKKAPVTCNDCHPKKE
jgi:cytochrome c553